MTSSTRRQIISICALLLLMTAAMPTFAQRFLTGQVLDASNGDSIPMASAYYYGHSVGAAADVNGRFKVARHHGWKLTFSAMGYISQSVNVTSQTTVPLIIRLSPDSKVLDDVIVTASRQRYSRKNNPAVELMRKVIEHKKQTILENRDFYQYNKYQKITLAVNDITPSMMEDQKYKNADWLKNQVEVCSYTQKLILPVQVDETVTQTLYRKHPRRQQNIVIGQQSKGVSEFFQTGDILNTVLQDVFTDVNIYDDQIRLLQHPFTSPIGRGAISFYRFYIEDTTYVERDRCIHLHFMPNNQQDFGFRGDIYILADSSYQVKRCELTIPKKSDVNFIDNVRIEQEFTMLPDSTWVLSVDDVVAELKLMDFLTKALVIRTTRLTDYSFEEFPRNLFRGKKKDVKRADAATRGADFWSHYRQVDLTKSEGAMDDFVHNISQIKGFKYINFGLKLLVENYVETSTPSKIDIGPINTIITTNFVDGLRTRLSGQTTANLNPHWFVNGYYARGWKSHKNYYKGEITYSFNAKEYLPEEFPKRALTFTSTYDVMSPSDKFLSTDKDNVFTAFKWSKVNQMMFYNRQQLVFEREEDIGLKTTLSLKTEENEAAGTLRFTPLSLYDASLSLEDQQSVRLRTTELRAELEYCPGATYVNTKQRRTKVNLDAPVLTLSHTMGVKNLLGGDYNYNYTEASVFKRFWLASWGKMDWVVKAGIQWNRVPYPLLIMPETNLSYIVKGHSFEAINNMEFPTDRFVSAQVYWDLTGKLFNRIPLLKKLKWREWISVRCLWGSLSDKNNPFLEENAGSDLLMAFPEGAYVLDPKQPYWELSLGIHNILKFFHVEYVRRLNYNDLPTAHKHGVRFQMHFKF